LPELPRAGNPEEAIIGRQMISFVSGPADAPIYERGKLGAGTRIEGPAILTQLDATTLLLPGQTAEVHPLGALIVRETGG
jgi:N-methylhydantoinase A